MFGFSLVGLDVKDAGVDSIKEPEGGPIVARSKLYAILAESFKAPEAGRFEHVTSGALQTMLDETAEELPYSLDVAVTPLAEGISEDDFQADYLRIFDVGEGKPPCPLYGGIWLGNRMSVMEEVVRFYNYFGLKASMDRPIPPDHLSTELEFLHYLTFREAAAPMPTLAIPYNRAQLDFLQRHPGRWFPKMRESLDGLDAPAYYLSLADIVQRFLTAERIHLGEDEQEAVAAATAAGSS